MPRQNAHPEVRAGEQRLPTGPERNHPFYSSIQSLVLGHTARRTSLLDSLSIERPDVHLLPQFCDVLKVPGSQPVARDIKGAGSGSEPDCPLNVLLPDQPRRQSSQKSVATSPMV